MGAVDRFTKGQFERVLASTLRETVDACRHQAKLTQAPIQGEYQYTVRLSNTNKRIMIRSSVNTRTGFSANTGGDSIRMWVEYQHRQVWHPLAKLDRWTTRVPGWEQRVGAKLNELYRLALADSGIKVKTDNGRNTLTDVKVLQQPPSSGVSETEAGENKKPGAQDPLTPLGDGGDKRPLFTLGAQVELVEGSEDEAPLPITAVVREPNSWQKEAIEKPVDAAVRVMAGPGSGKTLVIEYRYLYLVERGVDPRGIYAVTFTKSMAGELSERISKMVPTIKGTPAYDQICTIHALCFRILRAEGDKRRLAKGWQVKKAIEQIAEDLWETPKQRPGWKEIAAVMDAAKGMGLTSGKDEEFFLQWGAYHGDRLIRARAKLDRVMDAQQLLTFTDMVYAVDVKLREDESFRTRWQEKVQYMIIDEGQDVSAQAMRVLTTLAAPQNRFSLVGDIDQMMFRFAEATPESNLLNGFEERYQDGEMVLLPINYRSTREIVQRQLLLIQHNYDVNGGPYERRYLKSLEPRDSAPAGDAIQFRMEADATAEAMLVADTIREEMANGTKPGEIFVGARTRAQLGYLEGPLVRAKVPFINITGGSFWTLHHINSVVSYLRLAFDEGDKTAFINVYNIASAHMPFPWRNSPKYGEYCNHRFLGQAFLSAVKDDYRIVKSHVQGTMTGGRFPIRGSFQPGAEDLVLFVQEIQAEMTEHESPAHTLQWIIDNCYEQYLQAEGIVDSGDSGVMDDLATLVELAREFENVEKFLEYVQETTRRAKAVEDKNWDNYVVISTIHRLKGMERDVVFGIGLCEGIDPKSKEPRGLLPHTFSMVPPSQQGVLLTGGMNRMEDERCIAFVLVSRAKSRVYLSGCANYRDAEMYPSRFVQEMGLAEV